MSFRPRNDIIMVNSVRLSLSAAEKAETTVKLTPPPTRQPPPPHVNANDRQQTERISFYGLWRPTGAKPRLGVLKVVCAYVRWPGPDEMCKCRWDK